MFFYIYGKIGEFLYLIEIIAEIYVVDVLKSKMLIIIDIVDIKKNLLISGIGRSL
jgi:hypothetical protein